MSTDGRTKSCTFKIYTKYQKGNCGGVISIKIAEYTKNAAKTELLVNFFREFSPHFMSVQALKDNFSNVTYRRLSIIKKTKQKTTSSKS